MQLERLQTYFQERGIGAALLSHPAMVTWLTGYAPPIQMSPFEGGPALVWWKDGTLTLITSDAEAGAAMETGFAVRPYVGYSIEMPLACVERQAAVLREVMSECPPQGRVAFERDTLPVALYEVLASTSAQLVPVEAELPRLRYVKTTQELQRLRAALQLCDLAQRYVGAQVRAGISEFDLWAGMQRTIEREVGQQLQAVVDLVAGLRSAEIGGLPGRNVIHEGDAVILDIVPRLHGYWGDNAGTYFVGEPVPALRQAYTVVWETLCKGITAIKPGLRACDLDAMLRNEIQRAGYVPYPHHSGHGLGTTNHEEPRIVPYNTLSLEAGMVIALEPGIYLPGIGGVRLEHVVLVTEAGCEVLTQHLPAHR